MKLGRIPSLAIPHPDYNVRQLVSHMSPRSWEWNCDIHLNQGQLSACVGFSWLHFLAAHPESCQGVTEEKAVKTYKLAQMLDDYPGEDYEGTSVHGGVRAVRNLFPGCFDTFHWASNIDDLILALGYVGPVILGVNWYSGMYSHDNGIISVRGVDVGGHAILAKGVEIFNKMIKLHNSWGTEWGVGGDCWISFEDMRRLLIEGGEACIPTGKKRIAL